MNSILSFEKPEKILSTEKWKESHGFDGGPVGGYVPNMSRADREKWKAKWVYVKTNPEIEIRKTIRGVQILIIVGTKGIKDRKASMPRIKKTNVQMSQNGTSDFTFEEFAELNQAVQEAKALLEAKTNE